MATATEKRVKAANAAAAVLARAGFDVPRQVVEQVRDAVLEGCGGVEGRLDTIADELRLLRELAHDAIVGELVER